MATKKSSTKAGTKKPTPKSKSSSSTKLTNYQRRQLYQYWRKYGGLTKKEADKKKSDYYGAVSHNRQVRRFGAKIPILPVNLTPKQIKAHEEALAIKMNTIRKEAKLKELYGDNPTAAQKKKFRLEESDKFSPPAEYGKRNRQDKQKYLAQVDGYLKAIEEKSGRASKDLLKEFRLKLSNATTEKEVWKSIQEAYSKGLKPKFETDSEGNPKIRL